MVFGVRPESLRIAAAGLPARVVGVEYLGADTQIEACVGEQNVMLRMPGPLVVAPGENIHLEWAPTDAHWFEASSQCRIA
jgi:ABC-type sugar transport system ATPase subunit